MLAAKVVGAMFFVAIVGWILGALYDMEWALLEYRVSHLNPLLYWQEQQLEGLSVVMYLPQMAGEYFSNLWQVMIAPLNFSFITGEMQIVVWIVFFPIMGMIVYGLVMTVIAILRGTLGGGA